MRSCVIRDVTYFPKALQASIPSSTSPTPHHWARLGAKGHSRRKEFERIPETLPLRNRREFVALIHALLGLLVVQGDWQCVWDECWSSRPDPARMLERKPRERKRESCDLALNSGLVISYSCDLQTSPLLSQFPHLYKEVDGQGDPIFYSSYNHLTFFNPQFSGPASTEPWGKGSWQAANRHREYLPAPWTQTH